MWLVRTSVGETSAHAQIGAPGDITDDRRQKAKADSVEPGGFKGGLTDGWNALVSTVNHVVEVAGALLPWAVILIALYAVYRLVSRRRGWN